MTRALQALLERRGVVGWMDAECSVDRGSYPGSRQVCLRRHSEACQRSNNVISAPSLLSSAPETLAQLYLESGVDQWRRQDLVSGGTTIDAPNAPSGLWYVEGCPLPSRLWGLGERRELPQCGPGRSPGRRRIFCIF